MGSSSEPCQPPRNSDANDNGNRGHGCGNGDGWIGELSGPRNSLLGRLRSGCGRTFPTGTNVYQIPPDCDRLAGNCTEREHNGGAVMGIRWMVSGIASIQRVKGYVTNNYIESVPFVVEASTRDEASGKAMRVMLKYFPKADEWREHTVKVQPLPKSNIDPDGEIRPADVSVYPS